jgi:hypothetical protein
LNRRFITRVMTRREEKMFTSKTANIKKTQKLVANRTQNERSKSQLEVFAKNVSQQYKDLIRQRARATSEKRMAELDAQLRDHMLVNEVRALLKFHIEPIIAKNVTFGKINTAVNEAPLYGFTCVLSKRGDTEIIPDATTTMELMRFANARSMIISGDIVRVYQTASQKLFVARMACIDQTKGIKQALDQAASIGDEADAMIDQGAALICGLTAAFETMNV